jgi:MFS family permease
VGGLLRVGFAPALPAGWNAANIGSVALGFSHAYGVSLLVIGLFTTALFVTHSAIQVPAGRLCDRFGARWVGTAGLVVIAAASAGALCWREAGFAIGMRPLTGVGTGLSFVAGSDYVRRTVGSAVAQGVYGAGSMAGGGLALALIPQWGSWQAPFVTAAIVAGGGALVLAAAPRERLAPARRVADRSSCRSPRCTAPRSGSPLSSGTGS